ncbi:MAG: zinc ribbon domain-containing protein [Candidatus Lernaella stagnicola]|nr:zinc ribbon domain-containing protein [Candidatus Lernaella stagnicola]
MPIYEYTCSVCHAHVEKIQRITDPPLTDCPHCGAAGSLRKMVSQSTFLLKGSGWYVTDYKAKKPGAAGANGNGTNGDGATAKAEKSDEKPKSTTTTSESKTPAKDTTTN